MPQAPSVDAIAAVDLGSNSFHMVVARVAGGHLQVMDRLRDRVALAEGLDDDRNLTPAAQDRAIECLERFGQRLRAIPPSGVRAVGTNTFRKARNAPEFLARAASALGHAVEVISGHEEARLIYLGVATDIAQEEGRRLVIDIGGGSTECILGDGLDVVRAESLQMGCVAFSQRFFPSGEIRADGFQRAVTAARQELEPIERRFRALGWDEAIGSSGTVLAIDAVLRDSGITTRGITAKALRSLSRELVAAGHVDRLDLPGLTAERAPVLPGGLAILMAAFDGLGMRRMVVSAQALREGVLFDLIGRMRHEDIREQTIRRLVDRYQVDRGQAGRVERTALLCFDQVEADWALDGQRDRLMLAWGARLHEIGLGISYSGYHRHGAYIVANSDLPGFSQEDQRFLAALIHGHRRKVPVPLLREAAPENRALRLCALLRLATHLNRSRSAAPLRPFEVRARGNDLALSFPSGWLDCHPLTRADLADEQDSLEAAGLRLTFG